MNKLIVAAEERSGPYILKQYDLDAYHDLTEQEQEKIWKRLSTITMLECLPFGEAVLMEYLEVATLFEAAFEDSKLVAFRLESDEAFTDPDDPEADNFSSFVCPYDHDAFDETKRETRREAMQRGRDVRGLVTASKSGDFPKLPEAVSAHVSEFVTGVPGETVKKQMEKLKEKSQTGQSRRKRGTKRRKTRRVKSSANKTR